MIFCHRHERAFIPAGFDQRTKRHAPAHWEPLPWHLIAWAWRWAREGHCLGQLRIDQASCDLCEGEKMGNAIPGTQRGAG